MRLLEDPSPNQAIVVDDSKAMRMILSRILSSLGFKVHQAVDGVDGIERIGNIDGLCLALVDWNMPRMSGIEFVQAVRSDQRFQDVRMMMVTSESDTAKIASALEAGADEYAMKPFDVETIRAKLEMIGLGGRDE